MDVSGPSLRELYSSAKSKQEEIDSGSATHQEILQSAISAFEECRNLIAKLAVFSSNEEVEDISTQDLQYDQSALHIANVIDTFPDISRSTTCWQSSCLDLMAQTG
jgi:immunoglobulin-binding protein 1